MRVWALVLLVSLTCLVNVYLSLFLDTEIHQPVALSQVENSCITPRVVVKVFAWRRKASLERLINSLLASDYLGNGVDLDVFIEGDPDPRVVSYVSGIQWPFGELKIVARKKRVGLLANIVTSWDGHPCEYAVFLEDDIEVSSYWYRFARSVIDNSRYYNDPDLVGVSLYTPRYNQLSKPNKAFSPVKTIGDSSLFMFQLPCSWGALYFPDHWVRFRQFLKARLANLDEKKSPSSLWLPPIKNSLSNLWKRSWKRFYIEYMYVQGLYMLYPSFPGEISFATNHKEPGEHTGHKGASESVFVDTLPPPRKFNIDNFIVPLITKKFVESDSFPWTGLSWSLPEPQSLPVVDLYHKVSSTRKLKSNALENIVAPNYNHWKRVGPFTHILGPGNCVLDLMHRIPATSHDSEKFLIYEPQNGLSNQILELQDAFVFSMLLNRTLVVPPIIDPHSVSAAFTDPSLFFDLNDPELLAAGRVIHYSDYMKRSDVLPSRVIHKSSASRFTDLRTDFFDSLDTSLSSMPLYINHLLDVQVVGLFQGCMDTTLAFDNLFLSSSWRWSRQNMMVPGYRARLTKLPKWSKAVLDNSKKAIHDLESKHGASSYSCLHLRRGDFQEYCAHIAKSRATDKRSHYHNKRFDNFEEAKCWISPKYAAQELASRLGNNSLLYIATNEEDMSLLDTAFDQFQWVSRRDLAIDLPHDDYLWGAIDQALCEEAQSFYGNNWSTFSKAITEKRSGSSHMVGYT